MVQVAWGNVLSVFLPGVVVLFAMQWIETPFAPLFARPAKLSATSAACLVVLATLAGGILEALRRCTFDVFMGRTINTERPGIFEFLTPENHAMYQTGVENSYKYYTFYGNLIWAFVFLVCVRLYYRVAGPVDLLFLAIVVVLGRAAWLQYLAFERRIDGFIAEERRRRAVEENRNDEE